MWDCTLALTVPDTVAKFPDIIKSHLEAESFSTLVPEEPAELPQLDSLRPFNKSNCSTEVFFLCAAGCFSGYLGLSTRLSLCVTPTVQSFPGTGGIAGRPAPPQQAWPPLCSPPIYQPRAHAAASTPRLHGEQEPSEIDDLQVLVTNGGGGGRGGCLFVCNCFTRKM